MMLYCSSTLHLQLLRANSNLSVREKCKEKKNEENHHSKLPKPRSESTFPLHAGEKQLDQTSQGTVQAGGEEKALAPHWDFRKSAGRTQVEEWAGASTPCSFPAPSSLPPPRAGVPESGAIETALNLSRLCLLPRRQHFKRCEAAWDSGRQATLLASSVTTDGAYR